MTRPAVRRSGFCVVLSLVVLAAVLTGCGGTKTVAPVTTGTPEFALPDLAGKTVRLSDSAGTVRFVGFWATWCAPCVEEIPILKDLHAAYTGQGLTILMVSMDDEGASVVRPFAEKKELPYTVLLGTESTPESFGGISGLPTTFILDRDGKIVDRILGAAPRSVIEGKVKTALGLAG